MPRVADPTVKIALLRSAAEVFAESGLDAAKVEEITRRAKQSKGAFYLHFATKDDAFRQVVEGFLAQLAALYQAPSEFESLPDDPSDMLRLWLERDEQMFTFLWQNRQILSIVAGCQGQQAYLLETFRAEMRSTCGEWVEESQRRNIVDPALDRDLVTTLVCGAYDELVRKMLNMQSPSPIGEWLRQTLSVFMRGLGTPLLLRSLEKSKVLSPHTVPKRARVLPGRGPTIARRVSRLPHE